MTRLGGVTESDSEWTDWVRPQVKDYLWICCDCDLAHRVDFRTSSIDGLPEFRVARDEPGTERERA